jgi:hypothetical protein
MPYLLYGTGSKETFMKNNYFIIGEGKMDKECLMLQKVSRTE